jgi:hypothetical protein
MLSFLGILFEPTVKEWQHHYMMSSLFPGLWQAKTQSKAGKGT